MCLNVPISIFDWIYERPELVSNEWSTMLSSARLAWSNVKNGTRGTQAFKEVVFIVSFFIFWRIDYSEGWLWIKLAVSLQNNPSIHSWKNINIVFMEE